MAAVLISTLVFMALAMTMFSVRLIFKKNGEFKGTCANNNPMLQKEGVACGVCGRKTGEACRGELNPE
jgi:hypothetical protein